MYASLLRHPAPAEHLQSFGNLRARLVHERELLRAQHHQKLADYTDDVRYMGAHWVDVQDRKQHSVPLRARDSDRPLWDWGVVL